MPSQVIQLNGLDCADCATKIQNEISHVQGVKECDVSFATQRLSYQLTSDAKASQVESEAIARIHKVEPDVTIVKDGNTDDSTAKPWIVISRIISAAVLTGIAMWLPLSTLTSAIIYLIAYVIIGYDIILKAVKNTISGNMFDENFLMSIATLGALAIKQFPEAVAVMLFYQIGEVFQDLAIQKSRRSIKSLIAIRPDAATLITASGEQVVNPSDVAVGAKISVKPGEKIPLDGTVLAGDSFVDTAALTGESIPRRLTVGGSALSGTINQSGKLVIQVTKPFANSTVSKILDLVENASSQKAPTEQFITKFAKIYTPVVVALAAILMVLPPLVIPGATFNEWIYRGLVFLVISCPCALVISIPLSFFGGIGAASKQGILIKGSNYLEALNQVETIVFDKTGTLTNGTFKVTEIHQTSKLSESELLTLAASLEQNSNHPIAKSIVDAAHQPTLSTVTDFKEIAGSGVQGIVNNQLVLVGKAHWLLDNGFDVANSTAIGTIIHLAAGPDYLGYLVIADTLKPDTIAGLAALKNVGIKKTVMLTGDNEGIATAVGKKLAIDEVHANLLPQDKVNEMKKVIHSVPNQSKVAFVGDGINDTPVLSLADVGIAMGGLGSDAAIEAADMVIMSDEPSKLPLAIKIAHQTRRIVSQNIVFALVIKVVVLTLGALGFATMWEAVFADVGVTLLAVLNAVRVLKVK